MAPADLATLLNSTAASQAELDAFSATLVEEETPEAFTRALPALSAALGDAQAKPGPATNAAMILASACKAEFAREAAGSDKETVGYLVLALAQSKEAPLLRMHVLRAIGNLCYEHEENRRRLHGAGGVAALSAALEALTVEGNEEAGRSSEGDAAPRMAHLAGAGAILNSSGDDEALKKDLVAEGVIESLMWLLSNARAEAERRMALCSLARFTALDAAVDRMGPVLPALIDALAAAQGEAEEHAEVTELLRAVIRSDKAVAVLAQREHLARLEALAEDATVPAFVRQQAAVLLTVALGDDACQALLWKADDGPQAPFVQRLVAWTRSEDHEMQVAGAVGLGNLCRSDASAAALGQAAGLLSGLLSLLESNLSFVQHAALGALKNLCRLPSNRHAFVTEDGLRQLSCTLEDPQAPLQYATCSILRTLASSSDSAVTAPLLPRMLGEREGSFLPRLVHLGRSEELAVRAEASRALAAAVRAAASADRLTCFGRDGGAETLVRMLAEKHPLIQQEGTVALAILAACGGDCAQAIVRADGMGAVLQRMNEPLGPTHPPEALCNELSLVQQLLQVPVNTAAAGKGEGPAAAAEEEATEVATAGAAADGAKAKTEDLRAALVAKVRALAGGDAPAPMVQQHAAKIASSLNL
jgi:hypothetical protein